MKDTERRAYICEHKDHSGQPQRVFLFPGDAEPPTCDHGHRMVRQPNVPYQDGGRKKRKKGATAS